MRSGHSDHVTLGDSSLRNAAHRSCASTKRAASSAEPSTDRSRDDPTVSPSSGTGEAAAGGSGTVIGPTPCIRSLSQRSHRDAAESRLDRSRDSPGVHRGEIGRQQPMRTVGNMSMIPTTVSFDRPPMKATPTKMTPVKPTPPRQTPIKPTRH